VQSTTDEIRIQASKSITLTAGQSQIVIEGGNITFTCPGTWTVKGASHAWSGGGSRAASLMTLPNGTSTIQDWIELDYRDPELNQGVAGVDYEIHLEGGAVLAGVLDEQGRGRHENVLRKRVLKVVYKPRKPEKEQKVAAHKRLLA
jgi:type VI secretion system secreted protein VgrG